MKKHIGSFFIAAVMLFTLSIPAFAAEPNVTTDAVTEAELGELIQERNYVDENGEEVIEKIYVSLESGSEGLSVSANGDLEVAAETSGKGWYTKSKELANSDSAVMYVKAYFVWGDGDVSVSNASGWYEGIISSTTVSNESVTTGTGQYALVFNKYAYAKYYFVTTSMIGVQQGNTVKLTVSQSGNVD